MLIASKKTGCRSVGIEIDPIKVIISKLLSKFLQLSSLVEFRMGNMFKTDLNKADVEICYLLQPTNRNLMSKFENELKPGTRIVSHTFTFPGWKMVKEDKNNDIYLYIAEKSF